MNIATIKNKPGVYILQSQKNLKYYIGCTNDIENRLEYHNDGRVQATKPSRPWKLKFFQICPSITIARQAEYQLKKLKRRDYIEGIIREQRIKGKIAQLFESTPT